VKLPDIASHNLAVYSGRLLSWRFQRRTELLPPEASILERLGARLAGGNILDIGVGGGRTTAHLLKISRNYTGIDYSPRMIARCLERYPELSFAVCDARDLSRFEDEFFNLVFFSANGIDYASHEDRITVLREIFRVLAQGGVFVFSTHNRDFDAERSPWDPTRLPLRVNPFVRPLRFLGGIYDYFAGIANYVLSHRYEEQCEDYAIRANEGNNYRMLTHFVSIPNQVEQLERIGYRLIEVVGLDGSWLSACEYDRCRDPFLYYVCRR
jgi:ubiquinone/menaquinone biosynthesis C-methylase UbiE